MRFAILFLSLLCSVAHAQSESCLPSWTSLQTLNVLDLGQDQHLKLPLSSVNTQGTYQTKVLLQADLDAASSTLNLSVHFDDTFSGVSLPYNLYAVLVIERGEVAAYLDLTKSCTDPGAGIYPGSVIHLPGVQLKGNTAEPIQFIVWGRL